jgi:ribosome-associated protein YbcJ (S4-like RNA binding protein)
MMRASRRARSGSATNFTLTADHITLGQFLKTTGEVGTGGETKGFLAEEDVLVNGEAERRRGRKLFAGDRITMPGGRTFVIAGMRAPADRRAGDAQ